MRMHEFFAESWLETALEFVCGTFAERMTGHHEDHKRICSAKWLMILLNGCKCTSEWVEVCWSCTQYFIQSCSTNVSCDRARRLLWLSSKSIAFQIMVFSLRVIFVLTCSVIKSCSTKQKFNWWKTTAVMLSLGVLLSTQLHAGYY